MTTTVFLLKQTPSPATHQSYGAPPLEGKYSCYAPPNQRVKAGTDGTQSSAAVIKSSPVTLSTL